ncbi:MAG: lycopene cyclase domain-containing protein [Sediminicola sp.]|jgi:lycopene cyclase domain-containing protein
MPIYFIVLLASGIIPILFSIFAIDFIKNWKIFTISTSIVAVIFLAWDAFFTNHGVWGFTDEHCLGIYFLNMPIEEWMFFYVIPFCSLFAHFALFYAYPNLKLGKKTTRYISIILIAIAFVLSVAFYSKAYTVVNFSFLLVTITLGIVWKIELLQQFYISFLVILTPFFIVNGILTGLITDVPVVWYDDAENLGIRLITIPVEDIGYAFTMLFGNLMIFDFLNRKQNK